MSFGIVSFGIVSFSVMSFGLLSCIIYWGRFLTFRFSSINPNVKVQPRWKIICPNFGKNEANGWIRIVLHVNYSWIRSNLLSQQSSVKHVIHMKYTKDSSAVLPACPPRHRWRRWGRWGGPPRAAPGRTWWRSIGGSWYPHPCSVAWPASWHGTDGRSWCWSCCRRARNKGFILGRAVLAA